MSESPEAILQEGTEYVASVLDAKTVEAEAAISKLPPVSCQDSVLGQSLVRLTGYYRNDRTAPGIHCAWLADKGMWYASVKRYKGTETIVANSVGETLDDAITKAMASWVAKCASAGFPVT